MKFICRSAAALLSLSALAAVEEAEKNQGANRLAGEQSPYLRQHAKDPVHWYAWGEEAFAAARKQNKPIFLSVGFSTCHWCHVMGRESFANEQIAALMNEHFINIKLDREQRPDVDQVYMTFIQATTGQGGWPLNVWMTPELIPIVGGTYFPLEDQQGRPGFKSVLIQLAEVWQKDEKNIRKHAGELTDQLRKVVSSADKPLPKLPPIALLDRAFEELTAQHDEHNGGFGSAPKFPQPSIFRFLHHYALMKGLESPTGSKALRMSVTTLKKMAAGGIRDQLGGGFHRYSVDEFWRIPHYEKMLYVQSQLAMAYMDAAQLSKDETLTQVAREILSYVSQRMTHPEGGFYAAEDADSLKHKGADQKTEGAYYTWEKQEIDRLLDCQAPLFNHVYGIEKHGNAPKASDPMGKLAGNNTPYISKNLKDAAKQFGVTPNEACRTLELARKTLLKARDERTRPHRDEKIITAWNGLMISSYAIAYQRYGDPEYLEAATRAAIFIRKHLYNEARGVLYRSYLDGPASIEGYATDYAYLVQGLLDLYEAGFNHQWLEWANQLQAKQNEIFLDKKEGAYHHSSGRDKSVLLRTKKFHDDSEPSENSVSALNLNRLAAMLDQPKYYDQASLVLRAYGAREALAPSACPLMLVALHHSRTKPTQIVIAGDPSDQHTKALLNTVHQNPASNRVLLLADGAKGQDFLSKHANFYRPVTRIEGKATAYVCENFMCNLPTSDPEKLRILIDSKTHTE